MRRDHRSVAHHWSYRPIASALVGLLLAGCVAAPTENPTTNTKQSAIDFPPINDDFISWAGWGINVMLALMGSEDSSLSYEDLIDMQSRLVQLENQMEQFKEAAANMAARIAANQIETRKILVSDKYELAQSALDTVAEHPDREAIAENDLLVAANQISPEGYYMFSDVPYPDRFDPRFATPTFVAVVTSWLAVRSNAHDTLNLASRDKLREWANRLAWIASKAQASVTCQTVQGEEDEACGNGRVDCEKKFCQRATYCHDSTLKTDEVYDFSKTPYLASTCPAINQDAPVKAHELAEHRYRGDEYAAVAADWRAYSARANLALYRPAFQLPDPDPNAAPWFWGPASRAVDGNRDGNWYDGSVTHTVAQVQQPWWWIDLGSLQHITRIDVYNRTDCCASRLSHFHVSYSADSTDGLDGSWPYLNQNDFIVNDGDPQRFEFPTDIWARWIAVTKTDADFLSLAEVEVFGD